MQDQVLDGIIHICSQQLTKCKPEFKLLTYIDRKFDQMKSITWTEPFMILVLFFLQSSFIASFIGFSSAVQWSYNPLERIKCYSLRKGVYSKLKSKYCTVSIYPKESLLKQSIPTEILSFTWEWLKGISYIGHRR